MKRTKGKRQINSLWIYSIILVILIAAIAAADFYYPNLAGEARGGGKPGGGTTLLDVSSKLELLGNPGMIQYPNNPTARVSQDMAAFNEKIYIGIGDMVANVGSNVAKPGVWAFDTAKNQFAKEYEIQGEAIYDYKIFEGNTLGIYDSDPIGPHGHVYSSTQLCGASTFSVELTSPSFLTQTPATITLAPGETSTVTVDIAPNPDAPEGFHEITETVTNIGDPTASTTATAEYNIADESICYRPPVIDVEPETYTGKPGDSYIYAVRVYNKDIQPCPNKYFYTEATLPDKLTQVPATVRKSLCDPSPGYCGFYLNVTLNESAALGIYEFTNTVFHEGRPGASSKDITSFVVQGYVSPPPEPTPELPCPHADPSVNITPQEQWINGTNGTVKKLTYSIIIKNMDGGWKTSGPVTNVVHGLDVEKFDGKIFTGHEGNWNEAGIKVSSDGGLTFVGADQFINVYGQAFFILGGKLYVQVLTSDGYNPFAYYEFTGLNPETSKPQFQKIEANMMPSKAGRIEKQVYYNDKVVYMADHYEVYAPIKVVMVASTPTDARIAFNPTGERIRHFVKGKDKAGIDVFYALTSTMGKKGAAPTRVTNKIYMSYDLTKWTPLFMFKSGNIVKSFEWHNTGFYFGIGDEGASTEQPKIGNVLRLKAVNVP